MVVRDSRPPGGRVGGSGQIRGQTEGLGTLGFRLGGGFQCRVTAGAVVQKQAHAGPGEMERHGPTQAPRGAGDERTTAVAHGGPPSSSDSVRLTAAPPESGIA